MHREIVGITGIDILADIRTDEESLVKEYSFIRRIAVRSWSLGVEVVEMEISDVSGISPAAECLDKTVRDACHTSEVYMAVRRDVAYSLIGSNEVYAL